MYTIIPLSLSPSEIVAAVRSADPSNKLRDPVLAENLVPAVRFFDEAYLRETFDRQTQRLQTSDRRAAASLWHKHYNAVLLKGPLVLQSLANISVIAAPDRVQLRLSAHGLPDALVLSGSQGLLSPAGEGAPTSRAQRRDQVLRAALSAHMAPLITLIHRITGLSKEIMWGNVGNFCADLYDRLAADPELAPSARMQEDREAVLGAEAAPWTAGKNPLFRSISYLELPTGAGQCTVRVRRTCCQRYKLQGMEYCYTCPVLTMAERAALLQKLQLVK
jgi:ferric iron reductase protein FhuF